ncbi:UNVERIFIED_CONTAM: hypothetical protein Scaly_1621700 [Sesamum calycinum]|uniref:Reverse transcriptase zinc-binding domain-containing protein n=1 Tax=Sesamum calycinum TaxID=2727403 RepID=A0AAW2PAW1_9LAMI
MPLALDTDLKLVSIPLTSNISLDCPNPRSITLNIHIPYLPPDPNNRLYPFNAYCPTKPISSGLMQTVSKKQHLVDENFDEDFVTQGPKTKCSPSHIEYLKRKFDMHGICVPSRGKSGGFALLWPKQVYFLQSFSHHHIDVSIQLVDSPLWWRFTGLYGEPDTGQREITWNLLSRLHDQSRRAWLCAGDFIEILDQSEKFGGPPRPIWQIRKFREALDQCDLVDLGFTGTPFTWCNRHSLLSVVSVCGVLKQLSCSRSNVRKWLRKPDVVAKGMEHLRVVVDASMVEEMLQPYTSTEVKKARWIISPVQSAFVPGRLISDNVLLSFELNHFLNTKTQGEWGWMVLKLDVSKAYDKVEWSFLEQASPDNSQTICEVLETYREASGQEINFSKSSVTFSRNTREEVCQYLAGKEILIKAVLQAVPSYAMGCFKWPFSLLKEIQGCRWRVGSGTQIRIWADPWLPRPRSYRPITPVPVSLTEEMFWLVDSDIILSIPLSRIGAPDMFIWHYSYSDIFSVQSAYHLACSLENRLCSSSSQVLEQSWWRRVWQAKIPNKVKVFVWRACLNALPTGDNLARHIPNTSAKCPFCGCSKEDRIHVFVLCPFARQVWGLSTIPLSLSSLQVPDFWGWMQAVAAAPPPGCIKINFDDATFRKGLELGAGVVARDKNGACVAWLSRRFDRLGNAEIAEAMAAKEAIHLAVQRGWRSIIIEGDCANLIHKLQASEPDYSVTGPIVMDIQEAASNFLSVPLSLFDGV